MNDETVKHLTDFKSWLSGKIEAHQRHRKSLRERPVTGDTEANQLAIENLQGAYEFTNKLLVEALGEVAPEKD